MIQFVIDNFRLLTILYILLCFGGMALLITSAEDYPYEEETF